MQFWEVVGNNEYQVTMAVMISVNESLSKIFPTNFSEQKSQCQSMPIHQEPWVWKNAIKCHEHAKI